MANTATNTILFESKRKIVTRLYLQGDGTGEQTAQILVDVSALTPPCDHLMIEEIWHDLKGFDYNLLFDATTDVVAYTGAESGSHHSVCFTEFGGIRDTLASGYTGDLLYTTVGLGNGDFGTIIVTCKKKYKSEGNAAYGE